MNILMFNLEVKRVRPYNIPLEFHGKYLPFVAYSNMILY